MLVATSELSHQAILSMAKARVDTSPSALSHSEASSSTPVLDMIPISQSTNSFVKSISLDCTAPSGAPNAPKTTSSLVNTTCTATEVMHLVSMIPQVQVTHASLSHPDSTSSNASTISNKHVTLTANDVPQSSSLVKYN